MRTGIAAHHGLLNTGVGPPGYSPRNLQGAYDLPSATAGHGQTIAVVDAYDDPDAAADLAVYRSQFKLPACTVANGCFRKVSQYGTTHYPKVYPGGGWETEESLDLDMVSAICPNCHILFVEATSSSVANLGQAVDEAVKLGARYVSNSYGASESHADLTFNREYYDHPGVAITASSGDLGYGVEYPAASPYVTAVGGTTLSRDAAAARGWKETGWAQAGSGCSADEPKPSWQHDSGCPGRTVTDVSAVANPYTGVSFYDSFEGPGWNVSGGTSVAAPIIAASYALAGPPRAGSDPAAYPYTDTTALNPVTTGPANGNCDPAYLCTPGPGYDGPTGLGTPHGVRAFTARPYGDVAGTVTGTHGRPLAGATITVGGLKTVTDAQGSYGLVVPAGTYQVTARYFGYASGVAKTVQVKNTDTATESFALHLVPSVALTGTVADGSGHGWPLYAQVSVSGTPLSTDTSPATGRYRLTLPADASYRLLVTPLYAGYVGASHTVQVRAASIEKNFAVSASTTTCAAPGYGFDGTTQSFNQRSAPPGWTVDNPTHQPGWVFNDPGHTPNLTGGAGNFAIVPSAHYGWDQNQDTELISPVTSMAAFSAPVVRFDQSLLNGSGSSAEVDLSVNGGATWTKVWSYTKAAGLSGPDTQTVALPKAAGRTDVRVRFRDINPDYSDAQYWALDNVFLGDRACTVRPGGLVQGVVTDGNTGAGVGQATVTMAGHPGRTATATVGSRAGFYYLFAPAGTTRLRVSGYHYVSASLTRDVVPGAAVTADVALQAGRLTVSPGTLSASGPLGGAPASRRVTLTDTGRAPVHVTLDQVPGAFSGAGQSAVAPVRQERGRFSPLSTARSGTAAGAAAAASSWASLPDYPIAAMDNAVATDPVTGQIFSVGGVAGGPTRTEVTGDSYVYDPGAQAWTALPPLPTPRQAPQAALLGTRLYVTGGWDAAGDTQTSLEIYDPATNAWSAGASIPDGVAGAAVTVYDGQMYVIGGCTSASCGQTSVQIYDPATNAWRQGTRYPKPIGWESCGAIGSRIYCAGGVTSATTATNAGYAYTPATGRWAPIAALPASVWGAGYAASGGQLLLSGGVVDGFTAVTNQGFGYDPASGAWTGLPNAPAAVYRGGSACGFYRIGGSTGATEDPLADAAEQLPGYAGCGAASVPWLHESNTALTVPPGHSVTVTVTLDPADTALTQPGRYTAALAVGQDTPYPATEVGVRLTATAPPDWGEITGTVSGLGCHTPAVPLRGSTVQVDGHGASYTLTTGIGGRYALWLNVSRNPLRLITGQNGWQPQTRTVRVKAQQAVTADFTLHSATPCSSPAATVAAATTAVQTSDPPPARGVTGSYPSRPACPGTAKPGVATCLALVRTGVARHEGLFTATTPPGYGPQDLQSAYKLPSATAGSGATIAVVDAYDDPHATADLAVYRAQYGLPPCTTANGCFRKVAQNGSTLYPPADPTGGWETEESLDLDMVSAICPNCHILLVEANDSALPDLGASLDEAVALGADYISNSYGAREQPADTTLDAKYYDHPGVVITAASGDHGYRALGPQYPAASPYVTAVGGTTLTQDASVSRGWTETAWRGSGSGCSPWNAKPRWQHDRGCVQRTVTDVSADANPDTGVAVYDTDDAGGWQVVGGTSAATPVIAATYALAGAPATGTYPVTYPYAHARDLFDVTSGTNGSCQPFAYLCTARKGYDGPTGWGTPDGVAAFTIGPEGTVTGKVTGGPGRRPLAGAQVHVGHFTDATNAAGTYRLTVPAGRYKLSVSDFGYVAPAPASLTVANRQAVSRDLALTAAAQVALTGTVRDGSGQDWPLYAQVSVSGTTVSTVTDPATGHYRLTLPAHGSYAVRITPLYRGYTAATASIQVAGGGMSRSFRVPVSPAGCVAPGYRVRQEACVPVPGGLVQGVVTDGNTGAAVSGAQVTSVSSPRQQGTTAAAPQAGRYYLFVPGAGQQRFTATGTGYQSVTATAAVRRHAAATLDVTLPAGRLAVSPARVSASVPLGGQVSEHLQLTDTGHAPVTVQLFQQSAGVSGGPRVAATPAEEISGTFSPLRLAPSAVRPGGRSAGRSAVGVAVGVAVRQAGVRPDSLPWTTVPNLPEPVMDNAAATDPATGDVYSVGGVGLAGQAEQAAYVYRPSTGAWSMLPYMRDGRDAPQAAFIDGKLYVAGGWDDSGDPVGTLEIYDPATGAWSTGASDPAPYAAASVAVAAGQLYVIGGCTAGICGYNTVEIYNPATNTWRAGAVYPKLVAWESCGGIGATVYCAGGVNGEHAETKAAYAYDTATNRWTPIAPLPVTLWASGYAAAGDDLLVSGGVTGDLDKITNIGYAYDVATGAWTALPNAARALYRGGSTCGFYQLGGSPKNANPQDSTEQLPGYGICGVTTVPWLSQSRSQLTLQPGQSTTVTLKLNSAALSQPGVSTAELAAGQDTPYPAQQVPVTLTVTPPPGWGQVTGTVTGQGCHAPAKPLANATVQLDGRHDSYTLHTAADGRYAWWLPAGDSPLTLIVQLNGWQPQTRKVTLKPHATTTASFTLKPTVAC
ncbi:MAG TPA: carboxypeptidase regulatory-like domain-containing protein [Streptosporangiaceae bacterium]